MAFVITELNIHVSSRNTTFSLLMFAHVGLMHIKRWRIYTICQRVHVILGLAHAFT